MHPIYDSEGNSYYPPYMSKEEREALSLKLNTSSLTLYCGCRFNTRLTYKLSSDLKFIPEHHGYEHAASCSRGNTGVRKLGYVISDEGNSVAYLKFDFRKFTFPKKAEVKKAQKKEGPAKLPDEEKDETLDLSDFVRTLNYDTYMERLIAGKSVLTAGYFASALWGHTKKVYLSGKAKALHDYSIQDDNVVFFYSSFKGIEYNENSFSRAVFIFNNKEYSYLINAEIAKKAESKFESQYGCGTQNIQNVMAAGFLYKVVSRKGNEFKMIGRLHLFIVNDNGIYCNDLKEQKFFNQSIEYIRKNRNKELSLIPNQENKKAGQPIAYITMKRAEKKIALYLSNPPDTENDYIENILCKNGLIDAEELDNSIKGLI